MAIKLLYHSYQHLREMGSEVPVEHSLEALALAVSSSLIKIKLVNMPSQPLDPSVISSGTNNATVN